ncbi:hypothetical protein L6452_43387 [Arctium lappa]|uniref:Uncharacterized protein n=1 Tax=Arctium lappa TaxID=4217 RepID=A0ACB8XMP1_ARCLA|nr:hypothetical protein L6452_43387 [Arctium lappa]
MDNHILLVICILSSIWVVNGEENGGGGDKVKNAFGSLLDEAKEALGPVSSWDLDKVKDTFSPSWEEAKEALGPISSFKDPIIISPSTKSKASKAIDSWLSQKEEEKSSSDDDDSFQKELGPISSDDDLDKEALTPAVNKEAEENKEEEEIFSDSPSNTNIDDAQQELGPISFDDLGDLDKKDEEEEVASPLTFKEAKDALGSISSQALDAAKEKLRSLLSQNKDSDSPQAPISSSDSPQAPISSSDDDNDNDKDASTPIDEAFDPVSPSDEAIRENFGPVTSLIKEEETYSDSPSISILDEALKELGPIGDDDDLDKNGEEEEEEEEASPVSSSSISSEALDRSFDSQNKQEEETTSSDSSSMLEEALKELGPISSFDLDKDEETPGSVSLNEKIRSLIEEETSSDSAKDAFSPSSSSSSSSSSSLVDEEEKGGSISFEALKEDFSTQMKSSMIYFDHDVALAIESLIKQGQSNSELAIEEAQKLLLLSSDDPSPETGKCVKKCKNHYYPSCVDNLHKAMEHLWARNAELLTDDVNAVEGDISACQNCFLQNTQNQSPLKDLEEAIIKATRECLNVRRNKTQVGGRQPTLISTRLGVHHLGVGGEIRMDMQIEDEGALVVKARLNLGSEKHCVEGCKGTVSEQLVFVKGESMCILKEFITKHNIPNDVPDELSSEDDGQRPPVKSKKIRRENK